MKRKRDESGFEFRKRKKKERFRKEHRYDSEKQYWKNQSKKASREQKSGIEKLFAAAAGAKVADVPVQVGAAMFDYGFGPAQINTMFNTVGAGEAILGGAVLGSSLAVAGAAGAGYLVGEAINSLFTQTNNQVEQIMPATYQGKFQLSAKNSSKGLRDKYQKRGAVYITEIYGSVADNDIVFVGHSSFNLGSVAYSIGLAMLRKLFKIGTKLDLTSPLEELPLVNAGPDSGPDGYVIVYWTKDADGTQVKYTHTIANDQSLFTILTKSEGGFRLSDNLFECLTLANPKVLVKVGLYMTVSPGNFRLCHELDLTHEVLSIAMSSHMVLQNRTKSAAGADSTTQVDVQPVKGPVYEFGTGIPKLKSNTPIQLSYTTKDGIMLVRGQQLGGTDIIVYKEPLVKKSFQNVVKSAYVRLNPGALKSMTIGSDCKGYYANVLFKLRCYVEGDILSQCYGKSQMVMFEEELNSGSGNNITITYECQHIAGADFTTTSSPNMQPGFESANINNLPA